MKKVFCLYRGMDGADIQKQQDECREYAARQGWTIKKEFCEVKGNMREHTDSLIDLHDAAERRTFDILLVAGYEHIGRLKDETPAAVYWFENAGVKVISTKNESREFIELGKFMVEDWVQ